VVRQHTHTHMSNTHVTHKIYSPRTPCDSISLSLEYHPRCRSTWSPSRTLYGTGRLVGSHSSHPCPRLVAKSLFPGHHPPEALALAETPPKALARGLRGAPLRMRFHQRDHPCDHYRHCDDPVAIDLGLVSAIDLGLVSAIDLGLVSAIDLGLVSAIGLGLVRLGRRPYVREEMSDHPLVACTSHAGNYWSTYSSAACCSLGSSGPAICVARFRPALACGSVPHRAPSLFHCPCTASHQPVALVAQNGPAGAWGCNRVAAVGAWGCNRVAAVGAWGCNRVACPSMRRRNCVDVETSLRTPEARRGESAVKSLFVF